MTIDALPEAFAMALTDSEGRAVLPLSVAPPCTVQLAAVVKNARPAGGSIRVLGAGPHVLVAGREVDDSQAGNGDGFVSPGESATIELGLLNLGDEVASAVGAEADSVIGGLS